MTIAVRSVSHEAASHAAWLEGRARQLGSDLPERGNGVDNSKPEESTAILVFGGFSGSVEASLFCIDPGKFLPQVYSSLEVDSKTHTTKQSVMLMALDE